MAIVGHQPSHAEVRRQGSRRRENVRIVQRKIACSGAAHRVAGQINPVGVDAVTLLDLRHCLKDFVLGRSPVLARLPSVGADHQHAVFFGRLDNRMSEILRILEEGVLITRRPVEGHDQRHRPAAVIGARHIEAVGLLGRVGRRAIGQMKVLARRWCLLPLKREQEQQKHGGVENTHEKSRFRETPEGKVTGSCRVSRSSRRQARAGTRRASSSGG